MGFEEIWADLARLAERVRQRPILSLFDDNSRAQTFSASLAYEDSLPLGRGAGEFLLDYSKTNLDDQTLETLLRLAERAGVAQRRDAMFAGEKINETEDRAVLHTMLRGTTPDRIPADWRQDAAQTQARMMAFAQDVREGRYQVQGGTVTDIINIGIGGSDLGPAMATLALSPYHTGPRTHYLSNIDGAQVADTLRHLDPTRCLVVIASKTFTTIETMTNARTVCDWLSRKVQNVSEHLVAVSSAGPRAAEWGIPAERVFGFGDFIGGRYSIWGPVGLSLMLAIGPEAFCEFQAGAAAMDHHFREAPLRQNLPVLHAMVGVWHHQVCGYGTRAVLPYDQRLCRLPAYLQQLEMESNGKSVAMDGSPLPRLAGPIVWGEPGTNGQHAFYQLIHQGGAIVPCEFMIAAQSFEPELAHQHRLLIANCLAQSEALLKGRSFETALAMMEAQGLQGAEAIRQARHRVFPGNRPSVTLAWRQTTPFVLGLLIALYEHRVFVEGVVLGINSFDQWGVELGKELALALEPLLSPTADRSQKDGSTRQLLEKLSQK